MKTEYGDADDFFTPKWRIRYPFGDITEEYNDPLVGKVVPVWLTYGSMQFSTAEAAQRELRLMREKYLKRHPEQPDTFINWFVEQYAARMLKKPFNPFTDNKQKDDEAE